MEKVVAVGDREVVCFFIKSTRAKRVSIQITPNLSIKIIVPKRVSFLFAEDFLFRHIGWVEKTIDEYSSSKFIVPCSGTRKEFLSYKDSAHKMLQKKIDYFNNYYNFSYNRIVVKNQKTRWGSCSAKKNLNFNYQLYFLPERMVDYVVVHELCHLVEMNHSHRFWSFVAQQIPDYKKIRKEMRYIFVASEI